MLMIKYSN